MGWNPRYTNWVKTDTVRSINNRHLTIHWITFCHYQYVTKFDQNMPHGLSIVASFTIWPETNILDLSKGLTISLTRSYQYRLYKICYKCLKLVHALMNVFVWILIPNTYKQCSLQNLCQFKCILSNWLPKLWGLNHCFAQTSFCFKKSLELWLFSSISVTDLVCCIVTFPVSSVFPVTIIF